MNMIEKIDLQDYVRSGEGACGASYDCISDPDVMVKLYNTSYPLQPVYDELEVARKVFELGIPSPEPGTLVTDGERTGIRFRRIRGKRSFSRMLADEPGRTEEFAREMARICKRLHSTECPQGALPDAKQQFRDMLAQMTCLTAPEKAFLLQCVNEMPDGTTCLHGDLHIGNIITTLPKGSPLSEPHETYFIDLGYFAQGHPLIDLGMMANVCVYSTEDFIRRDMHISKAQAGEFFEHFLDEYFFSEDRIAEKWFGPAADVATVKAALEKAYLVKSILITYNLGFVLPELAELMGKYLR